MAPPAKLTRNTAPAVPIQEIAAHYVIRVGPFLVKHKFISVTEHLFTISACIIGGLGWSPRRELGRHIIPVHKPAQQSSFTVRDPVAFPLGGVITVPLVIHHRHPILELLLTIVACNFLFLLMSGFFVTCNMFTVSFTSDIYYTFIHLDWWVARGSPYPGCLLEGWLLGGLDLLEGLLGYPLQGGSGLVSNDFRFYIIDFLIFVVYGLFQILDCNLEYFF